MTRIPMINGVSIETIAPLDRLSVECSAIWAGSNFWPDDDMADLWLLEVRERLIRFGWSDEAARTWVELIADAALGLSAEIDDDGVGSAPRWVGTA